MPAKASCEVKTRTVHQPQKNGDIYVIERQTRYDPVKKYNVVLSSRIIGKIPKGETSVVPTRPKRSSAEKVSVSNIPDPPVTASRRKVGMMDIIDHLGKTSGIDEAIYAATDQGTAQKILSLARYLLATNGQSFPGITTWQFMHLTVTMSDFHGFVQRNCVKTSHFLYTSCSIFQNSMNIGTEFRGIHRNLLALFGT